MSVKHTPLTVFLYKTRKENRDKMLNATFDFSLILLHLHRTDSELGTLLTSSGIFLEVQRN